MGRARRPSDYFQDRLRERLLGREASREAGVMIYWLERLSQLIAVP